MKLIVVLFFDVQYGERVGATVVISSSADASKRVLSQMKKIARAIWSNPPMHGAKIAAEKMCVRVRARAPTPCEADCSAENSVGYWKGKVSCVERTPLIWHGLRKGRGETEARAKICTRGGKSGHPMTPVLQQPMKQGDWELALLGARVYNGGLQPETLADGS
eukprot:669466-Pelagomonas_calceolata.AAC.1